MNTTPSEKPNTPQDKALPLRAETEKPRRPRGLFMRRFLLPMIPIFVIIFIIAAPLAWLIAPSPTIQTKSRSPAAATTNSGVSSATATPEISEAIESDRRPPKPSLSEEVKAPPPPPNVYWSMLSQQLLELEKERGAILDLLTEQLPPPSKSDVDKTQSEVTAPDEKTALSKAMTVISEPSVPPPTVSSPPVVTEITWATIGQQVLELEKQRESAMMAVANKMKQ